MNEQTAKALRDKLEYVESALQHRRETELPRIEKELGQCRQTIAYLEDCKRQIEEDLPIDAAELHPSLR